MKNLITHVNDDNTVRLTKSFHVGRAIYEYTLQQWYPGTKEQPLFAWMRFITTPGRDAFWYGTSTFDDDKCDRWIKHFGLKPVDKAVEGGDRVLAFNEPPMFT